MRVSSFLEHRSSLFLSGPFICLDIWASAYSSSLADQYSPNTSYNDDNFDEVLLL